VVKELTRILLESLSSEKTTAENKEQLRRLLAQLHQRHAGIFTEASMDVIDKSDEDCRAKIEQVILSLSVVRAAFVFVERPLTSPDIDEPGF
jgi:hypothetical protein